MGGQHSIQSDIQQIQIHAYLAGPDVFYPNAFVEKGQSKKAICKEHGIIAHFPIDNEIVPPKDDSAQSLREFGLSIGEANEAMMTSLLAGGKHSRAVIFFNMRPWHGPSMDVGTAFEVGFMSALAHMYPGRVLIVGYTSDKRSFHDRIVREYYSHRYPGCVELDVDNSGGVHGPDTNYVENFGLRDNLMIETAVKKTGGQIFEHDDELEAFRLAVAFASKDIQAVDN